MPATAELIAAVASLPQGVIVLPGLDLAMPEEDWQLVAPETSIGERADPTTRSHPQYGLSLLLEIEHYVRGGLSPADAIRTATAVPAEAMGLGADLGTIEPGKLADLTIVDGNPLADIRDLRKTKKVVKDGTVYDVDELLRGKK